MTTAPTAAEPALFRRGLRLIGRSARAHPGPHLVACVGSNLFAAALVGFTIVLGRATDDLITPAFDGEGVGKSDIRSFVVVLLAVAAIRGLGIVGRRYFTAMATFRTQRTLRAQILEHYLQLPLSFHRTKSSGQLLAHADADVEAACRMLNAMGMVYGTVGLLILSMVRLGFIHPLFAVLGAVLFPALFLINRRFTAVMEVPARKAQAAVGDVSGVVHESFEGALVVKTLGREEHETQTLETSANDLRDKRIETARIRAFFDPLFLAIPSLAILAALFIGSWLVSRDSVTIGEVVSAIVLFSVLSVPVRILGFFLEMMPPSVVGLDRIDAVLAEEIDVVASGEADLPAGALSVQFLATGFRYGESPELAVTDLVGTIEAGESVALVGSTASGKSTILDLMSRVQHPTTGSIMLGGVPLADVAETAFRAALIPVFQEAFLFADSVKENVTMGRDASDEAVESVLRLVRADEFIAELPEGMHTVVGERGVSLSGGQRQRIALARALLRQPRVLLLDDATSAVDPVIEAEILGNLRRELDATLVVVAYRLATIRLADRVIYLDRGRIVADGSHEELLKLKNYDALVRAYELAEAG